MWGPDRADQSCRNVMSAFVNRRKSAIAASLVRPFHQISEFRKNDGLSLQFLSSRISWPINSIGIPGAVSNMDVAKRLRLRAYQDLGFEGSASQAILGFHSSGLRSA